MWSVGEEQDSAHIHSIELDGDRGVVQEGGVRERDAQHDGH